MLDLNTSLSSPYVLKHGLNPVHKTLNLNAESCLPLGIHQSDCDDAGSAQAPNDLSLAQKLKEMISTEHSSITASSVLTTKTPSDLGLLVDCEASSKHVHQYNDSVFEHSMYKGSADYGDCTLIRDGHKPFNDHIRLNLHRVSDSRLCINDCKLSLEGDSSSNDGKALPLESTGSVISTNGTMEEKQFSSNLKEVPYPHSTGVPSTTNIANVNGVCRHNTTRAGAVHACELSLDEDGELADHVKTKQLFPLRPSTENGEAGPTSNVLNYGNLTQPIINTNFERVVTTGSLSSSNVLNNGIIKTTLECIGASNVALRPPWLSHSFPSGPHLNLPSMNLINPITHGVQPVKKSRRGPRSRSSQYRGVTFYRRTGRWESHIWDCGKQVYLGGFDTAHAAARAYDRAAIRFRGLNADINFNIGDYESEINQMNTVSKEEFVHLLRRQSMGFSRGSSRFRGVTLHKCGRWEARMGQFLGKKAYDEAAIQYNGREAVTNFDTRLYEKDVLQESVSVAPLAVRDDDLELSLGTSLRRPQSSQSAEARSSTVQHPRYSSSSSVALQGSTMSGSPWLKQQMGLVGDVNQHILEGSYDSSRQLYKDNFLDNCSLRNMGESKITSDAKSQIYTCKFQCANKTGPVNEANPSFKLFKSATESTQLSPITHLEPPPLPPPPLAAGWAWQMQQNGRAVAALSSSPSPVAACTSSLIQTAAASSGFSPQQKGFTFPQWLHKTGLSYVSTASTNRAQ